MSHKVSELVWKHFGDGGSKKLVMLHLADHCDNTGGKLYPSIQTVARDCRMSESKHAESSIPSSTRAISKW